MNSLDRTIPPSAQPVQHVNIVQAQHNELPNGVRYWYINSGTQDICRVEFIFNAGSRFQAKSLTAKLTADLLLEGTSAKTGAQIQSELDYYGAFFEVKASVDRCIATVYSLNKHLPKVLSIFVDALVNASFPKQEFEITKNTAYQRFLVASERVEVLAKRAFNSRLFPNSPYGRHAVAADFEKIKVQELASFHQNHLLNQPVDVIIAGKVKGNEKQTIAEAITQLCATANLKAIETTEMGAFTTGKFRVDKKGAVQSSIMIGKRMFNRTHPDFSAMQVLCTVLGGYFGSRLMANIREDKGYTYGIYSALAPKIGTGSFFISTQVGSDVCEAALIETYHELHRLQNDLIPDTELRLVKNYMLGSMLKGFDGPFALADRFKTVHFSTLDYTYFDRHIETVNSVTAQRLRDLAQRHFIAEEMVEVVAGENK